jgi:hypothetical protein
MNSVSGFFKIILMVSLMGGSFPNVSSQMAEVVEFDGDILLGRPTDQGIAISVMAFSDNELYIEYGSVSGDYSRSTSLESISVDQVFTFNLNDLTGDSEYFYRLRFKSDTSEEFATGTEYSFDTAKSDGVTFSFAVQADPHLGARTRFEDWCGPRCNRETSDDKIYARTVENMLSYDPDFTVDLGDFFMTAQNYQNGLFSIQEREESAAITEAEVLQDVTYMRSLMTHGGSSIPLMLVQGNHEAEDSARLDGTPNNLAVWAINARKKYFPSPSDNGFYSGPTTEHDFIGRQDGYYAWEWGSALFIALDPFWELNQCGGPWCKSLGAEQFAWLKRTLESSNATFKFVFIHHLVGGLSNPFGGSRGGALYSDYFEWGGRTPFDVENWDRSNYIAFEGGVHNTEGDAPPIRRVDSSTESYDFEQYRPGWGGESIQGLLIKNNVQIVFHGHDHIYVKEVHPSGVIYQEVPQPSRATPGGEGLIRQAGYQGYDYEQGVVLPGAGFMHVTVSSKQVKVDYVRTAEGCSSAPCSEIADSYSVSAE